jgi:hypothetical protein
VNEHEDQIECEVRQRRLGQLNSALESLVAHWNSPKNSKRRYDMKIKSNMKSGSAAWGS